MEWRKLFQSVILDRGLAYYERGLVTDYRQGTKLIRATVQGSEEYDVRIRTEGEQIADMNVTVPMRKEGLTASTWRPCCFIWKKRWEHSRVENGEKM